MEASLPETSLKVLNIFGINEDQIKFETIIINDYLKSNTKIKDEIYSSYDLALSKKYKVKIFQATVDRIKNNFK